MRAAGAVALAVALLAPACRTRAPAPAASTSPPNVLLVSLDTLRADRLEHLGGREGVMPNLDRFAEEAIVFERAYSQSNETPFSHASLLTSRYPSELGHLDYDFRMPTDVPNLASVLRTYGYRTGAFVAGAFLSASFGFDTGFDTFTVGRDWGSLWHTLPPALAWIDAGGPGAPWFVLLHTYDMHARYQKPPPIGAVHATPGYAGVAADALAESNGTDRIVDGIWYANTRGEPLLDMWTNRIRTRDGGAVRHRLGTAARVAGRVGGADVAEVRAAYDGAATYLDALFGLLMAELQARGRLDDTVIAVFSDHGEELGEHGVFNHRWGLTEEVLHVPLMIRLPGAVGAGERETGLVELTDVLPTVLGLAGAKLPAGIRGRALVDAAGTVTPPERRVVFAEGTSRAIAARSRKGLLVFSGLSPDSPYLVEALDAAPANGPWFEASGIPEGDVPALREALRAWRGALPAGTSAPGAGTRELQTELREHGYWEPQ